MGRIYARETERDGPVRLERFPSEKNVKLMSDRRIRGQVRLPGVSFRVVSYIVFTLAVFEGIVL